MKAFYTLSFTRIFACLLGILFFQVHQQVSAQCSNAPTLKFHSPVLRSGTDGQTGAIYNFAEVIPSVDAHVEIAGIFGGATLYNIDDSAGIGYYDAFQPYVGAAANDTSYIDWKITFKIAGTDTDTSLACLAVTGVDVDGDGASLQEFIEAATPGSFSVDPMTNLSVSFDGVRSKAVSPIANIPMIDTFHLEAMFQMNFTNISSLLYRNGAISTWGAPQIRQTCIYFKPFFESYTTLPKTLLSFSARALGQMVEVKWSASDEGSVDHYTLQKSENGSSWISIGNTAVLPSHAVNHYLVNDFNKSNVTTYYRLVEVSLDGKDRFSRVVKIDYSEAASGNFIHSTVFTGNIRIQSTNTKSEQFSMAVYSISGVLIAQQKYLMHAGVNTTVINMQSSMSPGICLLVIKNDKGQAVYHSKLIRSN